MNNRLVCVLMLLFISMPAALSSRVYLEHGEEAVNVGLLTSADAPDITQLIIEEYGGVLVREVPELLMLSFIVQEDNLADMSGALSHRVRYIEPDCIRYIPELPLYLDRIFIPRQSGTGGSDGAGELLYNPNDPRYGQQWGPQAIDAQRAWNHFPQNHDVILAIVDTGVDVFDEDMQPVTTYRRYLDGSTHKSSVEHLPAGTYHYRLRAGDRVSGTRKVTLEK